MPLPTHHARPIADLAAKAGTAGAAGLVILAAGCASASPHPASSPPAQPRHVTARPAAARRPEPAPAVRRAAPAAAPTTGATRTVATAYAGPHFTTPQAAMAYLAAAYNDDDITAMHALTDPQAFASLQAMRPADADFRLTSCTATPRGDYVCSVRYHGPAGGHAGHQTAMLIAAPALNPGWYMYRFISGCD